MKCRYCSCETTAAFCSKEHEENHAVFHILENITEDLDLVYKATVYPWKVRLTRTSYDTLRSRPGTHWDVDIKQYVPRRLVYQKGDHEYLVCWENNNIPFVVNARIADRDAKDDAMELDDLDRPNIEQEHRADFDAWSISEQ